MFDNAPKPLLFLVIGFAVVVLYQASTQERQIDASGIANSDPWFEQQIYSESRLVLVKFGAEWCGPCRSLDTNLEEIKPWLQDHVKVVRVDVDQQRTLAGSFGVASIPHSFILYRGKIVSERKGGMATAALKTWIVQSAETAYRTPTP
jgi:thioredoxin-like negative regulator of GroEL